MLEHAPRYSLRSKCSRTKRTKFGQHVIIFRIRDARKMGREQKGGRKGVGEGKEGNACTQTPRFWKTCSPTNGAPDWCGVVILIDKCIKFAWMIPVITRAWLAYVISESFSAPVLIIDRTRRSNRNQRTLIVLYGNLEFKKPTTGCCFPCKSEFTRADNFQTKDSDFRFVLLFNG